MWCPRLSIAATRLRAWCSSTAFGIRRVCRNRLPRYVDAAGLFCKHYAGYDFSEATCLQSLRHTVIPMLFIHGEQDDIVSSRFLKINYEACSSIDREKLMVPDARHMEASVVDPELYWNTVNAFIKRAFEL